MEKTRIPSQVWERARRAGRRLLLIDYDGTLAPFHLDPMRARPDPRAHRALLRIAKTTQTEIAVVSGRPISELETLLGDFPGLIVGEHGWEWRRPHDGIEHFALPRQVARLLESAAAAAANEIHEGRIARKRTSVVVHLRGIPPARQVALLREAARIWSPFELGQEVKMRPIVEGVELRALGRDKGTAVDLLVGPVRDNVFAMFLGDDETDEDAFRAVREIGLAVQVGPTDRDTCAHLTLDSIEDVAPCLEAWCAEFGAEPKEDSG